MRDVQQAIDGLDRHPLSGEVTPHVVAVLEDADPTRSVHPASHGVPARRRLLLGGVGIDDLGGNALREGEAPDGCHIPDRLVG
jgi:hypothetical protein